MTVKPYTNVYNVKYGVTKQTRTWSEFADINLNYVEGEKLIKYYATKGMLHVSEYASAYTNCYFHNALKPNFL